MNMEQIDKLISEGNKLIEAQATSDAAEFIKWITQVELLLKEKFGNNSNEYLKVKSRMFYSLSRDPKKVNLDDIQACKRGIERTVAELEGYKEFVEKAPRESAGKQDTHPMNKVFIVHGHDGELKEAVARLIEKQNIKAVILSEQANRGHTIIEKIEENSDAQAAICLFTGDDMGKANDEEDLKKRAHQNVIFEAGYFMGKLSRENVILIADTNVEMPSDLHGVIYTDKNNWKVAVLKELKEMGFNIDPYKLVE